MFRRLSLYVLGVALAGVPLATSAQSIARDWDEQCLASIRIDTPHPPVQARNLFALSACLYDAWAAYDPVAVGFAYRGKHSATNVAAARREAISYAAWRILRERYALSRSATNTLAALDAHMVSLGYNTNNVSTNTATPAGVGNAIYAAVSDWFINDGARQLQSYADYPAEQGGYIYLNPPLVTGTNGTIIVDVNHWQRLAITNALDQNGFPLGPVQNYLGAQWNRVRPFALSRTNASLPWIDFGSPPSLIATNPTLFRSNVVEVIRRSSELTTADGVMLDISPASLGNNSLGTNDGHGYLLNPVTGLPYQTNLVKRGDYVRCLAEFWADGPSSETPPGHWNTLANGVSDYPGFQKRLGGTGPVLDDLEWDVKTYFALNAALHDAATACWTLKRYYDGWRPVSAIRYMAQNGQCTYSNIISGTHYELTYNPNGLPIIPGLIEQVNSLTALSGQRHAGLPVNKIVIYAWPGQPADPTNQASGVKWIAADWWLPFQKSTFVTPAFPGYASGHSTFSRAAAEVMTGLTGSQFFPGGLATYTCPSNAFLTFERGPTANVQFQWATYYDAADAAGLSRIWGGIHPPVDDLTGRRVGNQAGQGAWGLAKQFYDGTITNTAIVVAFRKLNSAQAEIRFNTPRGFYHRVQSTMDLKQPFTNEPGAAIPSLDTTIFSTNSIAGAQKFFRVVRSLTP
jgi:hypothetical protein